MGTIYYGGSATPIHIEDRVLAHLKVVVATKLRRGESFTVSWQHPDGETRGRSDAPDPPIPLHEPCLGNRETRDPVAVNENMAGGNRQPPDCGAHRLKRGPADVPAVDSCSRDRPDPPCRAGAENMGNKPHPSFGGQELRVTQPRNRGAGTEDDRRGHHRSGEATPPRLVHTGDLPTP